MSFSSIPVLDLGLAREPDTRQAFLTDLRHALLEVGFMYIKNFGVPESLLADVVEQAHAFFEIPEEEKCVHVYLLYLHLHTHTFNYLPDSRSK